MNPPGVGEMKYFRVNVVKKIRSHDRSEAGVQNKIRGHDTTATRFSVVSTVDPAAIMVKKYFRDCYTSGGAAL